MTLLLSSLTYYCHGIHRTYSAVSLHLKLAARRGTTDHIMALSSTGESPLRPLPKTRSHKMIEYALDQLQLCSLKVMREEGLRLQMLTRSSKKFLYEAIRDYRLAQGPEQLEEIIRLRQEVVDTDDETMAFLIEIVSGIDDICHSILQHAQAIPAALRSPALTIEMDNARADIARLQALMDWLRRQYNTRQLRPQSPLAARVQNSMSPRLKAPDDRQYDESGEDTHSSSAAASMTIDTSSLVAAILRASGRHPSLPPLNASLDNILNAYAVRQYNRGRKRKFGADTQHELAQEMIRFWQAKDEADEAKEAATGRGKEKAVEVENTQDTEITE